MSTLLRNISSPPDLPSTLSDVISAANTIDHQLSPTAPVFRIGFLRNVTLEGIEPYLRFHLLATGMRPRLTFGGYGSLRQDLMLADSQLMQAQPDMLATALMLEELDSLYGFPGWTASQCKDELESVFKALETSDAATIALNTFIPPFDSEVGFMVPPDASDLSSQVSLLNDFVRDYVRRHSPRFCLIDWERLARRIGRVEAMDYRYWYLSRSPFKRSLLDSLARELVKVVCALSGCNKKCLVLDCDNTLWGGIIGEDGLHGIKLDGHDYPGRAFYDFQKTVLHLIERGVLVLLCSKNNEEDVFEVLDKHPWNLIKRSHLSGFRVNWKDKASNLEELSIELNLGLESFVFVDDNSRELELVRQMLPQVTTLEVPTRLYEYPTLLLRAGVFDTLVISNEDRKRSQLYQTAARRKEERSRHTDLESYLASLELVATVHPSTEAETARVAQLTQKTNQFNLTTRRYSDRDIERFRTSLQSKVYTLSASDRFGALGLVGVLIVKLDDDTAVVDTLLMSCRALGRELETAFTIDCMKRIADAWDIRGWQAEYIQTAKNSQVNAFWEGMGFSLSGEQNGHKHYRLQAVRPLLAPPRFIKIIKE